jgi:hypothetical protein
MLAYDLEFVKHELLRAKLQVSGIGEQAVRKRQPGPDS